MRLPYENHAMALWKPNDCHMTTIRLHPNTMRLPYENHATIMGPPSDGRAKTMRLGSGNHTNTL
eukprot:6361816-Pyramimonas_sp.AAC.1